MLLILFSVATVILSPRSQCHPRRPAGRVPRRGITPAEPCSGWTQPRVRTHRSRGPGSKRVAHPGANTAAKISSMAIHCLRRATPFHQAVVYFDVGPHTHPQSPYFRFHRTPSFESSITTPFASSSTRIASARAKFRVFLACVRSATSASISSSAQPHLRHQLRRRLADPPFSLRPCQRRARQLRIAIHQHREHAIEQPSAPRRISSAFSAPSVPASAAEFAARTISKIAAVASAVFRSFASAAVNSAAPSPSPRAPPHPRPAANPPRSIR